MSTTIRHNLHGQIIGEIEFLVPYRYTFVYSDNRRNSFDNIVKMVVMSTGCYVLTDIAGTTFVVRQLHDYVIEKPMEQG